MRVPGKLIVRAYAPVRRWLFVAGIVVATALALYLLFELGRYEAGYDVRRAIVRDNALMQQIEQLHNQQHDLRVQLAAAQEGHVAQLREQAEVARTIGELQARVASQQQEIQFYRGLVPQQSAATAAVRVQQFHIAALPGAQQFALRFTLNRPVKPEEQISGTVAITIDGTRNASAASVNLATLSGGKRTEVPFSFRYYADLEQDITLPPDFKPDRVTLAVRPARGSVAPYRQTFVWSVNPA